MYDKNKGIRKMICWCFSFYYMLYLVVDGPFDRHDKMSEDSMLFVPIPLNMRTFVVLLHQCVCLFFFSLIDNQNVK